MTFPCSPGSRGSRDLAGRICWRNTAGCLFRCKWSQLSSLLQEMPTCRVWNISGLQDGRKEQPGSMPSKNPSEIRRAKLDGIKLSSLAQFVIAKESHSRTVSVGPHASHQLRGHRAMVLNRLQSDSILILNHLLQSGSSPGSEPEPRVQARVGVVAQVTRGAWPSPTRCFKFKLNCGFIRHQKVKRKY